LVREGDVAHFIYWANQGVFRAGFTDSKGNVHSRAFFSPDTVPFVSAYVSFVMQEPSLVFLEALEDGEVLSWHRDYIQKLETTDFKWLYFFKKQLDVAIQLREKKEWQSYTLTPEEQYLAFVNDFPSLVHTIPQHYIASYLGIAPETLSRIRKRMSA
jgi:CRP-like cAMP-binding protein